MALIGAAKYTPADRRTDLSSSKQKQLAKSTAWTFTQNLTRALFDSQAGMVKHAVNS